MSLHNSFQAMDALRLLEFRDNTFDLVNQRYGMSWVRTWDWPVLLREYQRVAKSAGIIRLVEGEVGVHSSSRALTHLLDLATKALHAAGHLFTPSADGLTSELAVLLHRYGVQFVQTRPSLLDYRAGTPQMDSYVQDITRLFRTIHPFLNKWLALPPNYHALYQQMLAEFAQPDAHVSWKLLTLWGEKSKYL